MAPNQLRCLPNVISALRLLAVPVLVWLAWRHQQTAFAWLLVASLVSDIADGLAGSRAFDAARVRQSPRATVELDAPGPADGGRRDRRRRHPSGACTCSSAHWRSSTSGGWRRRPQPGSTWWWRSSTGSASCRASGLDAGRVALGVGTSFACLAGAFL